MDLPKDLKNKIWDYCRINDITDINGFIIKTLKKGFDIEVYGILGKTLNEGEKHLKTNGDQEKWLEKEVIVEKRVEIPVEVIIEKEIIKEVPIEKIVEKIVTVYDKSGEKELGEKIAKLEQEISNKDKELDELRQKLDINLDKTNEKMLQETLQKLRKEITEKNKKIQELEKLNNKPNDPINAIFMKGSNLKDII